MLLKTLVRTSFLATNSIWGRLPLSSITSTREQPIKCTPYRTSFKERQHFSQLLEEMKTNGLFTGLTSPWAAPVLLVKKKDGSFPFCCDWRKLNVITKKDSIPLPRLDDTLDRLANATYFTKLDFTCGYHQIELDNESKEKSAFITPDGLL